MAINNETLGAALGILSGMPDTAAHSAAEAAASAQAAQDAADAVDVATVEETLAYMDIGGSVQPADEVAVEGSTPEISAATNTMYVCGTVSTLSFTPNPKGLSGVQFTSGATPTVLTVPDTVQFPAWFDKNNLEASATYEINVRNGVYGVVALWA